VANIFDTERCDVPPLERLPSSRFITNCEIPSAPGPIKHCPDLQAAFNIQQMLGPSILPPDVEDTRRFCEPGVGLDCLPTGAFYYNGQGLVPVANLFFNKSSSFFFHLVPSTRCADKFDIMVDIGGGPPGSIFWQPPGGLPARWTTCPQIANQLTIGSISNTGLLRVWGRRGEFILMSGGRQTWVTPVTMPGQSGGRQYLFAKNIAGDRCVELDWSYGGVSGSFQTYSGGTVTVQGGLVVGINPSSQLPGVGTTDICLENIPCSTYSPCG
jgi:hypothetical protein